MGSMMINPKKIVRALRKNAGKVRETARMLGISPGTVIFWGKRAEPLSSLKYLKRDSTRPWRVKGRVVSQEEGEQILSIRKGTGFGASKIRYLLQLPQGTSTVHRFLKGQGLIQEEVSYRRPRNQPTTHMHARNATMPGKLQMDVKYVTPQLSGLPHTCFLYAVMDIYSRFKQGIILPLLDQSCAITALEWMLPIFPFKPDFIQTDNGLEFQSRFTEFVAGLGWQHHHIHKSSPNENAVIERSFRTDEEEFFFLRMEHPKDLTDLNVQYQLYLDEYNTERPHLSLDMMTPMEKLRSVNA